MTDLDETTPLQLSLLDHQHNTTTARSGSTPGSPTRASSSNHNHHPPSALPPASQPSSPTRAAQFNAGQRRYPSTEYLNRPTQSSYHQSTREQYKQAESEAVPELGCLYWGWGKDYFLALVPRPSAQFVLSVCYCIGMLYWDCIVQIWVQGRAEWFVRNDLGSLVLPDLGFRFFPIPRPLFGKIDWPNFWAQLMMIGTALRFVISPLMRGTIFRRWIGLLGFMFMLRSVSIALTLLPNPYLQCQVQPSQGPMLYEAVLLFLQLRYTCADVLFSGHTVNITLAGLIWHGYSHFSPLLTCGSFDDVVLAFRMAKGRRRANSGVKGEELRETPTSPGTTVSPYQTIGTPADDLEAGGSPARGRLYVHDTIINTDGSLRVWTPVKVLVWCAVLTGFYLIIASRFHYSVDVYIGWLLTVFVWKSYHSAVRTCYLRTGIVSRFLQWFERDAEDVKRFRMAVEQVEMDLEADECR